MRARECVLLFGEAEKMNKRNLGAPTRIPLNARDGDLILHVYAKAVLLLRILLEMC
jgi:hypothetical protein